MVLPNNHATVIKLAEQQAGGWGRGTSTRDLVPEVDLYMVRLLGELQAEQEPNHLEPLAAAGVHGDGACQLEGRDVRNENWSPYDWR